MFFNGYNAIYGGVTAIGAGVTVATQLGGANNKIVNPAGKYNINSKPYIVGNKTEKPPLMMDLQLFANKKTSYVKLYFLNLYKYFYR